MMTMTSPFRELDEALRLGQEGEATSLLRRRTRCSQGEAREFIASLGQPLQLVKKFPDIVAVWLEDPAPSLLARYRPQRSTLLRLVRRRQTLEAMRLLGELPAHQSRQFLRGLWLQGEHWELLEGLYREVPSNFWERRPLPEPPPEHENVLLFPPEEFQPELLLEWLSRGQHRAALTWVRRLSGAPRESCQALVDGLEEALFEGKPNPWDSVIGLWPEVVAGLAGLPDPLWLGRLASRRKELLELVGNQRRLAAVELLVSELGCSSTQARRFLKTLGDGSNWDSTLSKFLTGRVFEVKKPPPPPSQPKPAPRPTVLPGPELKVEPPPTPPPVAEELLSAPPPPPQESKPAASPQVKIPSWLTEPDPPSVIHEQVEVQGPPPLPPFTLDDRIGLLERLARLGEQVAAGDMASAEATFDELHRAGFNRAWVVSEYPPLERWVPDEPWKDDLRPLGQFSRTLSDVMSGRVQPEQLLKEAAEKALRQANLDQIVTALEKAWKSKKRVDLEAAVGLLKQHPELTDEINQRIPWLSDLMDLDHDGTADILEVTQNPGQYFADLVRSRHPEILQRLGEAKVAKIQEAIPELLEATRQRNMRSVMRIMSRLRLGPSDVKTLLGLIKGLLKRK